MFHAWQLRQELGATLIGEPTGGRPWGWGYVGQFELPFSRLTVQYSTQFYRLTPEDREAVAPDLTADISAPEYFGRFDPWFAIALAGGATRGLLRVTGVSREDGGAIDGDHRMGPGALLRIRGEGGTYEDARAVVGHIEAEVAEREPADAGWQLLIRIPENLRGDTPIYVVSRGELSNSITVPLIK
jgi:hypothetical protein